jgi:hypothetical protein
MSGHNAPKLAISDLKTGITYLLCPDKDCGLFWDTSGRFACEHNCPRQADLTKILLCSCGKMIELPGDHHEFARVDHKCSNGSTTINFSRMSGKYQLIYKKPEEKK